VIALRPVEDGDLDALFEQMRDPEAVRMAAFTAEDPDDRSAFDAHMVRVLTTPGIIHRAVTSDGGLVGQIASFPSGDETEITYWIDRAAWGRGIASQALALLLELVTARPLHARAASDNLAPCESCGKRASRPSGPRSLTPPPGLATSRKPSSAWNDSGAEVARRDWGHEIWRHVQHGLRGHRPGEPDSDRPAGRRPGV
jgi:hypothetical protein